MSNTCWNFTPSGDGVGGVLTLNLHAPMTACQREYVMWWVEKHLKALEPVAETKDGSVSDASTQALVDELAKRDKVRVCGMPASNATVAIISGWCRNAV